MKNQRKAFSQDLYNAGEEAEVFVMNQILKSPENFEHKGQTLTPGNFLVCRNSDKYGVDLLVLVKNSDKTFTPAFGVEVVRRTNVTYPTIFIEGNKTRYYEDGLPIMVIVVDLKLEKALVLDTDKRIDNYPSKITNFNDEKVDELNYLVPRNAFIEWTFELAS